MVEVKLNGNLIGTASLGNHADGGLYAEFKTPRTLTHRDLIEASLHDTAGNVSAGAFRADASGD